MWIVTREINRYDQDGAYFVAAYKDKPREGELKRLLPEEGKTVIDNLLIAGGGRIKVEWEWFYLFECEEGVHY